MARALSESLSWLRRKAWSFIVVVAVLIAGAWLHEQYQAAQDVRVRLDRASAEAQVQEAAASTAAQMMARADQALAAKVASLRLPLEQAQRAHRAKQSERDALRAEHPLLVHIPTTPAFNRDVQLQVELAVLLQAVRAAESAVLAMEAARDAAGTERQLREQARDKQAEADRLRLQRQKLSDANPWMQRWPGSGVRRELDDLKARIDRLDAEAALARQRAGSVAAALRQSREFAEWVRSRDALATAQLALQEARSKQAMLQRALEDNTYRRLTSTATRWLAEHRNIFWTALLVLLGAALARFMVKVFLYYVVAPWVGRREPVRLAPEIGDPAESVAAFASGVGTISRESVAITVDGRHELLIRPEYIQSSSGDSNKRTALLLHKSLPFTSVAVGMYLLTRIRSATPTDIIVSPSEEALHDIAVIDLPEGSSFVCHARALVGIVQPVARPIRVTRRWRLASAHAWLTMQLRFVIFHGPGKLLLVGRRGIRQEGAVDGRLIGQSATIGFDASLGYSNVRSETFVPYWLGREDLFKDRFSGERGSYVYEERPARRGGNPLTGRGVEGVAEGVLRIFGL